MLKFHNTCTCNSVSTVVVHMMYFYHTPTPVITTIIVLSTHPHPCIPACCFIRTLTPVATVYLTSFTGISTSGTRPGWLYPISEPVLVAGRCWMLHHRRTALRAGAKFCTPCESHWVFLSIQGDNTVASKQWHHLIL